MDIETKTATAAKIAELVGRDLTNFKIVEMTEVCLVNDYERTSRSLGFFKDSNVATAFVEIQSGTSHRHEITPTPVLTDGTIGYAVRPYDINIFDDEAVALEIKRRSLNKFSPAVRKLLGLE